MGKQFKSDKPSIEEIRRLKKPNKKTVQVLLESELKSQIEEVQSEIHRLELTIKRNQTRGDVSLADPTAKQLAAAETKLEGLMEEAREATVEFTFQDIGRKKYDDLLGEHTPTDEQKTSYKENGGEGALAYNVETFPPALIAAVCIDPVMTLEDAQGICDEWSEGDIESLFFGAIAACKERTNVPLSKGESAATANSPSSSDIVSNMESVTPTS